MSPRFTAPNIIDLTVSTECPARRGDVEDRPRPERTGGGQGTPARVSVLWVLGFYGTLTICAALWWHWDVIGWPRLFMGTVLIFFVLLRAARMSAKSYPFWIVVVPTAIVVAAFFYYPLAPTAVILRLVFIFNVLWFS